MQSWKKKKGKKFWLKNESTTGLQYTSKQERDVKQKETKGDLAARVVAVLYFRIAIKFQL